MQTINDPVFGTMTFTHSWKTKSKIDGIGEISLVAQAYPGDPISDLQRSACQTFLAKPVAFLGQASAALSEYIAKVYPAASDRVLTPEKAFFRQDGVWGFLYPSPVSEDDGLSVRFEDGCIIADTDDALF